MFDKAKFGDRYVTKDGRMALYYEKNRSIHTLILERKPDEDYNVEEFIIEVDDNGKTLLDYDDWQIVSREYGDFEWRDVNDSSPKMPSLGKDLEHRYEVKTQDGTIYEAYYGIGGWCMNPTFYSEYIIKNVVAWRILE